MIVAVPLFANFTALPILYLYLFVGSQRFSVVFDTGSADLLLPLFGCASCGTNNTWTPPSHQSIASCPCPSKTTCTLANQCAFTAAFGGIAEQALLAADSIGLSHVQVRAAFGAVFNITAPAQQRKRQAAFQYPDGLWGAAFASIGSTGHQLWDSLRSGFKPPLPDVFGHCFGPNGGVLSLGGPSPFVRRSHAWIPITAADFYRFNMIDMVVDGVRLNVSQTAWNAVAAIVDTGTPTVNVPVAAFAALRAAIAARCAAGATYHGLCDVAPGQPTLLDGACFSFTAQQARSMPQIAFLVGDASAPVKLEYAASAFLTASPYQCSDPTLLSFALSSPGDNFTVLGASFMTAHAVAYDRASMRLGFAPSHGCPTPH